MKGALVYAHGKQRELVASAKWQDLRDTVLGNPRRRKPEWVILFALSTLEGGSVNNRMTRTQAEALVEVLTKALNATAGDGKEFLNLGPTPTPNKLTVPTYNHAIRHDSTLEGRGY